MFFENINTALSALLSNKLRTILTLLGVIIGTFAVTSTISLGEMATAGISGELESLVGQSLSLGINREDPNWRRYTTEDIEALSRLPVDIVLEANFYGNVRPDALSDDKELRINLTGYSANVIKVNKSKKLKRGRYFDAQDEARAANVMVLKPTTAERLFPKDDSPIGREITVTGYGSMRDTYTVIGVLEPATGTLASIEALFDGGLEGEIPITTLYNSFPIFRNGEYNYLELAVNLDHSLPEVRQQVEGILDRRMGENAYQIYTGEQGLSTLNNITRILQIVLGGIGGISLLVGGIGILNIMLVSVTERTREIGLRKALGAKKATIMQQFLIEAIVLTVLGGLMGLLLSIGVLSLVVAFVPFVNTLILNPTTIMLALFTSIATGVIFGVWPARRAANLSPTEALRFE